MKDVGLGSMIYDTRKVPKLHRSQEHNGSEKHRSLETLEGVCPPYRVVVEPPPGARAPSTIGADGPRDSVRNDSQLIIGDTQTGSFSLKSLVRCPQRYTRQGSRGQKLNIHQTQSLSAQIITIDEEEDLVYRH